MDYIAINTLISKAVYKDAKICLGSYDSKTVGITVDGFVLWLIPESEFLFDKRKVLAGKRETEVKRLIPEKGYTEAILTNTLIAQDKKTLVLFKTKDTDIEVYVDKKLLKTFDPRLSSYKVKDAKSGVLVYEGDKLVGLIMPTIYNQNNRKGVFNNGKN